MNLDAYIVFMMDVVRLYRSHNILDGDFFNAFDVIRFPYVVWSCTHFHFLNMKNGVDEINSCSSQGAENRVRLLLKPPTILG